ncbi:hypothetical protein J7399_16775 [Shimia sp. R9_1]|uniref:hypothetical protein n=1 Tax=unclassified Shimia TaxID=2630038 RepID=UPI001ADC4AB7|nr:MULTISPECIES: hypothetical protein [unclassified Shimia]MBO9397717.1 hypothetical protein [Shimia sp. R9_2]MBO9402285.1 hypothetical protein [Shimia sp. R9_3]MBO9409092.1 hypothetical protein [Shimia sp. R9_1]
MKKLLSIPLFAALAACGDLITVDLDTLPEGPIRGDYRTVLDGIPATVTARAYEAEVNFTETGSSIGYGKLFALADSELRRQTACREVRPVSHDTQRLQSGVSSSFIFELDECPRV